MAIKKIYIGSVGPFEYDDSDPINDVDGDFSGETQKGLATTGKALVGEAPTADEGVVRKVDLLNLIYPVGSIYLSVNSTTPSDLFGGTWERIAEGQFLVGELDSDSDFGTAEGTGGAKTHSHSASCGGPSSTVAADTNGDGTTANAGDDSHTHSISIDSASHLPPYFTIYAWKRTA